MAQQRTKSATTQTKKKKIKKNNQKQQSYRFQVRGKGTEIQYKRRTAVDAKTQ
jgi:hypothetical protein